MCFAVRFTDNRLEISLQQEQISALLLNWTCFTMDSRHQTKLIKFIFIGIFLVFIGCSGSSEDEEADGFEFQESLPDPIEFDLEKIKERGSLIALVDNNSFSYFLYQGKPMGYEYELLETMASRLGVKLIIKVEHDLQKLFEKLLLGEGDVIAHNLTVTKERKDYVSFTEPFIFTKQVLIQRKPPNWENKKAHEIEKAMIRNAVDLIGKKVTVRAKSSFYRRLENLSEEIGGDIIIAEADPGVETEELIDKVASGEIMYTIADMNIANMTAAFYREIDAKTELTTDQQIAWAVRPNSEDLLEEINKQLKSLKQGPIFNVLYKKYFNPGNLRLFKQENFKDSIKSISPYDELIKEYAGKVKWDWKLLTAQIYRESRFHPNAKSHRGALGLMQVMPATGQQYGVNPNELTNPEKNLYAGTKFIEFLNSIWAEKVQDSVERIKFILASYNVGQGHVLDARRLAAKYGDNNEIWDGHVAEWIKKKSYRKYYTDPVVQFGYCRGIEPYLYVQDIEDLYKAYVQLVEPPKW